MNRWRRSLLWGLAWLAAAQAAIVFFLEWRRPEFLDPKYGCRLLALKALRRSRPARPLFVALGSSRAEQGFRPGVLTPPPHEDAPLFYNLARGGSSPLLYLVTLRRLLDDGVRPDVLLVEIFPPALAEDEGGAVIYKPTLRDWPVLRRYPVSGRSWGFWLQDRLLLWYKYRNGFLAWAAPPALAPRARWGDRLWDYQGGEWRAIGAGVSAAERRRLTDDAHRRYAHTLSHFHIAPAADRALRELLDACRERDISTALFLMPEAAEFRGWYPAGSRRRLSDYLDELRRTYELPVIDARGWVGDDEFSDAHHLLAGGAAAFTRRFAAEVSSAVKSQHHTRRTP